MTDGTATPVAVPLLVERVAGALIRRWCGSQLRRHALLHLEGLEHIPRDGPVLLACRHVHHLYDGCVLLAALPRPVRLVIALDWIPVRVLRRALERVCGVVGWPVVARATHPRWSSSVPRLPPEVRRAVRRALDAAARVLCGGGVLAVFPEGYPNVDPVYSPKAGLDDFAPFLPGFAVMVERAQAACGAPIPIVPVGFAYRPGDRWRIMVRCGPPMYRQSTEPRAAFVAAVQDRVRELSRLDPL